MPATLAQAQRDVVILGGGLAGLTCALHLRQTIPALRVTVLERATFPLPEAAHKVGESTVEIGAFYFAEVLGLREHLETDQLRKLGLRYFFPSDGNRALDERLEVGVADFFPSRTYQIDRGRFENYLYERARDAGVEVLENARVRGVELSDASDGSHCVSFSLAAEERTLTARWVVDASGVGSILKKKLGLERSCVHNASAAWFRIGAEINIDTWSDRSEFTAQYSSDRSRWLSTNHLFDDGYWVWLIPLASNSTSVGIVADSELHPLSEYNTYEKALDWLEKHEPQCAAKVREHQDKLQDFLARKHYPRRCTKVFSEDRWAITGDAGIFIDPFYSPGSDYIGISNTFICDLISRDLAGEPFERYARIYNELHISFADNTFLLFEHQYPIFGNSLVMIPKIVWDLALYWSFLAFVFLQRRICDLSLYVRIRSELERVTALNDGMQRYLRERHDPARARPTTGRAFLDLRQIELLLFLNKQLSEELTAEEFVERLSRNVERLAQLDQEIRSFVDNAVQNVDQTGSFLLRANAA